MLRIRSLGGRWIESHVLLVSWRFLILWICLQLDQIGDPLVRALALGQYPPDFLFRGALPDRGEARLGPVTGALSRTGV